MAPRSPVVLFLCAIFVGGCGADEKGSDTCGPCRDGEACNEAGICALLCLDTSDCGPCELCSKGFCEAGGQGVCGSCVKASDCRGGLCINRLCTRCAPGVDDAQCASAYDDGLQICTSDLLCGFPFCVSSADCEPWGGVCDDGGRCKKPEDPITPDTPSYHCAYRDERTVAAYAMEGGLADDMAAFHGEVISPVGALPAYDDAGPTSCGMALLTSDQYYVVVDDAAAFHLTTGAIEFWMRSSGAPAEGTRHGVVSRDAKGKAAAGHISAYLYETEIDDTQRLDHAGRLIIRAQEQDGGDEYYLCSMSLLPAGAWIHVGVNLGDPFELYIDGVRQQPTAAKIASTTIVNCNGDDVFGIDGNSNPWVLGVASDKSDEGDYNLPYDPFVGGAIDEFGISSVRRDFASSFETP